MTTLIIKLCDDHSNVAMHFNDEGVFERSESFTQLRELNDITDHKLIVLLPGTSVHMLTATLPSMSATELQQAAPNIVEEQLSEDINGLYFAVGEADSENKRHIAVIRQTIWDTLIHDLKENNLSPSLIIPDYLALPIDEESWTIFCGQPQSLVRLGKQQGYACDTNLLETLISLNLNEAAQAPNSVKIIHEPN